MIDILSIPSINDINGEFDVELKMEFKWKDERLNIKGLEKKTNFDPRRYQSTFAIYKTIKYGSRNIHGCSF